jgi:hypothetical protein
MRAFDTATDNVLDHPLAKIDVRYALACRRDL